MEVPGQWDFFMGSEKQFLDAVGSWADDVAEKAGRGSRRLANDLRPGEQGAYLNGNLFAVEDLVELRRRVFTAESELSILMGRIADLIDGLTERP